jgi:hypothetical protein
MVNLTQLPEDSPLNVLGLVKIPTKEGALFLYPGYVEIADRFTLPAKESDPSKGGSRHPEIVTAYDGTQYVAKKEREDKCSIFTIRGKQDHLGNVPKHGNLSAKEVSIARALSELAEFEDDVMAVRFERPYGYFESRDGQRTSLFQYEPRIKETEVIVPEDFEWPSEFKEIIGILRPIEHERIAISPYRIRYGVFESTKRGGKGVCDAYAELEDMISELYVPQGFASVVTGANGVRLNEYEKGFYRDDQGRIVAFMLDFEFARLGKDVGGITRNHINDMGRGGSNPRLRPLIEIMGDHKRIDQMQWVLGLPDYDPHKVDLAKSEALMKGLRQRVAEMQARIRAYTWIHSYTVPWDIGRAGVKTGPAYNHIQFIRELKDPAELVIATK